MSPTDLRRHVPPITLVWDDEVPGALSRVVDGTLVFADISGFTALTERLSRRGRIGAEEIVDTLNRVFGPMLRIAASRGGELLKFGGDALLFLFRGDGHPEQACDAAVEMRTALREAAAVPTSVGRLSLSMSVGIHSGDVVLFLVGSPTRELLILGPAASATAQAEKVANAGEIVVSPATAARLPPGSTRPRADGELLVRRRAPHTSPVVRPSVPDAGEDLLRTLFPVTLGEYLAPGPPDPEHRIATIAFIRFSGTDAILRDQGHEMLGECLHALVSGVEEALDAEGVTLLATDIDSDGGKFFLGSGVPTTQEDDEGRMLRALRRIADAGLPLPLQLGVNRGHVFAAEVGIPERAAYSAMGDTTNTAARIMSTAPLGAIHAHPVVLEHSRTRFAVTPAGPFAMKGKAVPLAVYAVGEETGTRESVETARLPLLGRDDELAVATAAVETALAGAGGVVTIDGATGMGKTRLATAVLDATAPDHRVVLRAEPYGASSAYRVLRDPLRTLLDIPRGTPEAMGQALLQTLEAHAPDLLPFAPLVADVVQVDVPPTPESDRIDPQYRPDRVADVVIELVARVLPGSVAVVVEDAQWADGASARLLARVAGAATGRRWAVLVVRRGESGGFAPESGPRILLDPLPPDVIERLVIAATENTPLLPHQIAVVVERAGGNPLFVEEVTRLAIGSGSLDTLPESVQAAMSTQIDQLPPPVRRILRYCAVLGRSFRRQVLDATLAADGLDLDAATTSALARFLEDDGPSRLRFRNSLVRDAAYEGLAYRVRGGIHRTAGQVLERMSTSLEADSPTLLLHFSRAGDTERTWRYARMAGELARRSYANADAADHFETALDVSRRMPGVTDSDRATLWASVGELRELAGMFEDSVDAYRRAVRLSKGDPLAAAEVLSREAAAHLRMGAFTTTLRVVSRARVMLARHEDDPRAKRTGVHLDNITALVRVEQERPREAKKWALQAMEGAREIGEHETLVRALMLIDHADHQLGVAGLGERHREALKICMEHGLRQRESTVRMNLGAFAYYAGRWPEAAEWYRSSRQVALEAGSAFVAAQADVNLAELLINQGRTDEAEVLLTDALRVLRAMGAVLFHAQGEMQVARIHLARGELEEAERRAGEVVETFSSLGNAASALEAALVQAEAVLDGGRPAEALDIINQAEHEARAEAAYFLPRTCLLRGRALLALDRIEEAEEILSTGLLGAGEQDLPYERALLLQVSSSLARRRGRPGDAEAAMDESAQLFDRLGVLR
ncbi:MAG TPA: adenylate/guanylate cyclase domain-containing protein [Ornithinibacter sp.]|nr:adenylate/guanylate cyclase domain-containing protein [Ornithinibacter sp.]